MGPSNISFISFRLIFHFQDYGRKGNKLQEIYIRNAALYAGDGIINLRRSGPAYVAITLVIPLYLWMEKHVRIKVVGPIGSMYGMFSYLQLLTLITMKNQLNVFVNIPYIDSMCMFFSCL